MPEDAREQELLKAAIAEGYEPRDVNVRSLTKFALTLMISLPIIMLVLWVLHFRPMAGNRYSGLTPAAIAAKQNSPTHTYPKPHLITLPGAQLAELRAQEQIRLDAYGWVNRTQGVVRIPIERAMELTVQRGLPVMSGNSNVDGSEYELIIQRRIARDRAIREGRPLEE